MTRTLAELWNASPEEAMVALDERIAEDDRRIAEYERTIAGAEEVLEVLRAAGFDVRTVRR